MELESPYPLFPGLNLSWDMLEGLAKHNGPVTAPTWAMREADAAFPLELGSWASLEAQVAAIADDIAYDNHDIDDGLRAGLLTLEQLMEVRFVRDAWSGVKARYPDVDDGRLVRELVRNQIGLMVNDLLAETQRRIVETGVRSVEDVRAAGGVIAAFSPEMTERERELKRFMYATLYHHSSQLEAADRARRIVTDLFAAYHEQPALMSSDWEARAPEDEPWFSRHIADFIAGMTDRFAENRHAEIFGQEIGRHSD